MKGDEQRGRDAFTQISQFESLIEAAQALDRLRQAAIVQAWEARCMLEEHVELVATTLNDSLQMKQIDMFHRLTRQADKQLTEYARALLYRLGGDRRGSSNSSRRPPIASMHGVQRCWPARGGLPMMSGRRPGASPIGARNTSSFPRWPRGPGLELRARQLEAHRPGLQMRSAIILALHLRLAPPRAFPAFHTNRGYCATDHENRCLYMEALRGAAYL